MKKLKVAFCIIGIILIPVLSVSTTILWQKESRTEEHVASNLTSQLNAISWDLEGEEFASPTTEESEIYIIIAMKDASQRMKLIDEYLRIYDIINPKNPLSIVDDLTRDLKLLFQIIKENPYSENAETAKELILEIKPFFAFFQYEKREDLGVPVNTFLLDNVKRLDDKIEEVENTPESLSAIHSKVTALDLKSRK